MKVTIIIPNYNGKHFMEPCLKSLAEQTYKDFKILVVDNASSDGSVFLQPNDEKEPLKGQMLFALNKKDKPDYYSYVKKYLK